MFGTKTKSDGYASILKSTKKGKNYISEIIQETFQYNLSIVF